MIIIMRNGAPQDQVTAVIDRVSQLGFKPHISPVKSARSSASSEMSVGWMNPPLT